MSYIKPPTKSIYILLYWSCLYAGTTQRNPRITLIYAKLLCLKGSVLAANEHDLAPATFSLLSPNAYFCSTTPGPASTTDIKPDFRNIMSLDDFYTPHKFWCSFAPDRCKPTWCHKSTSKQIWLAL